MELWLLLASIALLHASFFTFLTVYLKLINESIGFQAFEFLWIIYNYLNGFCMDRRSVESVRLHRHMGKIWITEISIAFLFDFFSWCWSFCNKFNFSLKDFIAGNWTWTSTFISNARLKLAKNQANAKCATILAINHNENEDENKK